MRISIAEPSKPLTMVKQSAFSMRNQEVDLHIPLQIAYRRFWICQKIIVSPRIEVKIRVHESRVTRTQQFALCLRWLGTESVCCHVFPLHELSNYLFLSQHFGFLLKAQPSRFFTPYIKDAQMFPVLRACLRSTSPYL